jgi:hypothetical protein
VAVGPGFFAAPLVGLLLLLLPLLLLPVLPLLPVLLLLLLPLLLLLLPLLLLLLLALLLAGFGVGPGLDGAAAFTLRGDDLFAGLVSGLTLRCFAGGRPCAGEVTGLSSSRLGFWATGGPIPGSSGSGGTWELPSSFSSRGVVQPA